jgi:hypothetical protein
MRYIDRSMLTPQAPKSDNVPRVIALILYYLSILYLEERWVKIILIMQKTV